MQSAVVMKWAIKIFFKPIIVNYLISIPSSDNYITKNCLGIVVNNIKLK